MGIPNVLQTGRTGMSAAKANIATTGHNISNSNTEGFSRQRVGAQALVTQQVASSRPYVGEGVKIGRIDRVNDAYIEKQLRNGGRELAHFEERKLAFTQIEDIFNEMGGDGLNRMVAKFFNEFRKLSNDPASEAVREAVRESANNLGQTFKNVRTSVEAVRQHINSRIEGDIQELNSYAGQVRELNLKIFEAESLSGSPNDLLDQRELLVKKMATFADMTAHQDEKGFINIELKGIGPLVTGPNYEKLYTDRTPKDNEGKAEGSLDIAFSPSVVHSITHQIKGGKLGALLEARDSTINDVLEKFDVLAFSLVDTVNSVHTEGFSSKGQTGINFFKPIDDIEGASAMIGLSDEVQNSSDNLACALAPNSPGDNRIALKIAALQNSRLLGGGVATFDEFYNSIISEVGVASAASDTALNQQIGIMNQLAKIRDQISGVSIDEETANLLQYQHAFDASAKVIQVADEMLKTILDIKR